MSNDQLHFLLNMLKLNPLVFDGSPMELMRDTFDSMGDKMANVSGAFREECRFGRSSGESRRKELVRHRQYKKGDSIQEGRKS